jgi:hypothetical protein
MAEAVATLALASSILQVIDFGTKVASTALKVYQASKRDDGSLYELEKIYKNLSSTLDTIQMDGAALGDSGDLGLKSLSKDCSEVAGELVNTLHKLGFGEAKTKRKALRAALKRARKDGKIRSLQARLNEFRSQLSMCLLVSVRYVNLSDVDFPEPNTCYVVNLLVNLYPSKEKYSRNLANSEIVQLEHQSWTM